MPTSGAGRPQAVIVDVDGTLFDSRESYALLQQVPRDVEAIRAATLRSSVFPQAREFVERHHGRGRVVVALSARADSAAEETLGMIRREFGEAVSALTCCPPEHHGAPMAFKLMHYRAMSLTHAVVAAIDDHPATVEMWRRAGIPEVEAMAEYHHSAASLARGWNELETLEF